ncbi:MAG: malto-oligosyltrehalose synthase [Ilumatobacter sp.]|uniref:malto-oligosyltrehalose synthase n=1 Tax=Ilumatobacter sp. TaxID=1967498 RepID=UPI00260F8BBD|nr:malto-oligosyltrehalose synthase [Ilumatobacter sp.]MDJ0770011.1 malto-oligosyltrehalose synthase [Ilumatobacter sp.]
MTVAPVATYRFQLTPEFGFDDVAAKLDHVQRLGASHVYLPPVAQSVPESSHGYDVVDHTSVRAEFGGAEAFERLLDTIAGRGMAAVVDHVPNHMASTRPDLNPHWWALLRDGPGSAADDWFDVDWELTGGTVILPVLGGDLDAVVAGGDLVRDREDLLLYGERRLPVAAGTGDLPLPELLEAQHYRLHSWRHPQRNVRRFFMVDDLVAVRVEHPHVAEVVDTLPTRYAGHPGFGGVRVDHVDGLADPQGYLQDLRSRIGHDVLLYVEKIVAPDERLPPTWPVDGTTGYEFMRSVDHVLLDAGAEPVVTERWIADAGDDRPFHDYEAEARREVVAGGLAPDFERLARVAARALDGGDHRRELLALTTDLPRYRTYLPGDPDAERLIGDISDGPVATAILDPATPEQHELRSRWQQLTGPVMAKGAEDCAFYRYLRLASVCEVGGDPGRFGRTVAEFHEENLERSAGQPLAMLAGSTHDTKRSEDVRARSAALTWRVRERRLPLADGGVGTAADWAEASQRWVNDLVGLTGLDAVTVSLGIQTALCAPGVGVDRMAAYLLKATREAGVRTNWDDPDADFEARLRPLAEALRDDELDRALALDRIAPGITLAATTLRLTSPGVPDIYQGAESFTYRLVDPDNRPPPDWGTVTAEALDERTVAALWSADDPAVKASLVRTLLDLRRRHPGAFGRKGSYRPIDAGEGVIAYERGDEVVVAVRRGLAAVDRPFPFPAGAWYDVLDPEAPMLSGTTDAASIVGSGIDLTLPIAVFERE